MKGTDVPNSSSVGLSVQKREYVYIQPSFIPRNIPGDLNFARHFLYLGYRDGWKNRSYVRVQLVRNDVQIPCCIHGLLYHSHGFQRRPKELPPKHNTATTDLCMTYCTLSRDVPGLSESAVGDDAWSAKTHEWNVCCVVPYPTVSTEQCASILFYLALHCIALSAEPLSGSCFASPCETVSDDLFFDSVWTSNTMSSTTGFTIIHPLCINTNNCGSRTNHKPLQSALYQRRLSNGFLEQRRRSFVSVIITMDDVKDGYLLTLTEWFPRSLLYIRP
ncbi:uncharacterized protein TNCV_4905181 [Trichonephila clavipes]|uniref:Uncharacterized protein n=1 Tax=Trichonephila clavipes TaxID=2585209 RepID=A0A8X6RRT3_TRICX|nr:uncharacterized protein TNCV_4905181 [Trichonephila clavipes]